jgi:hypothetical protein
MKKRKCFEERIRFYRHWTHLMRQRCIRFVQISYQFFESFVNFTLEHSSNELFIQHSHKIREKVKSTRSL